MRPEHVSRVGWNRSAANAASGWWTAVGVYAAAIFVASSASHPFGVTALPPFADKGIHALVYGGFSLTIWMALRRSAPRASTGRLSVFAVVLATLYGLSDEIHQAFVPGREMDVLDLAADGAGACAAQGMLAIRSALGKGKAAGSPPGQPR